MRTLFFIFFAFLFFSSIGQIPAGYYNNAQGLIGDNLQSALHNIIKNHNDISYSALWSAYESTDKKSNGKVWDMYSDVPGGTPPYQFTFFSDQCGNYGQEGDCYNREHSFPKSWFGGTVAPMNTELFQVYPTDGYVNGKRSNYPFGEVGTASWTSQNGCKLGNCISPGYSGTVFEPIDEYKGDFARTYFYMATRYLGEDNNWPGSPMVDGAQPKTWALNMLFEWHQNDPVSDKEINRNNAVHDIQNNRNPFIDVPFYADQIWFNSTGTQDFQLDEFDVSIFPNPAQNEININLSTDATHRNLEFNVMDQTGRILLSKYTTEKDHFEIGIENLISGMYFIIIQDTENDFQITRKLIKQ